MIQSNETCVAANYPVDFRHRPDSAQYAIALGEKVFSEVCRDYPTGTVEAFVISDRGREWVRTRE